MVDESLVLSFLATTGPAGGIGGAALPMGAIIGGLVLVGLPYVVAVAVAAQRGALGTGRDEIRTRPGPPTSMTSVRTALGWLAEASERRSIVLTDGPGRHATLEPSAEGVTLTVFDGTTQLEARDVGPMIADDRARGLLAADLERLVGGASSPVVSTFERVGG
jgi:hypothetical protein